MIGKLPTLPLVLWIGPRAITPGNSSISMISSVCSSPKQFMLGHAYSSSDGIVFPFRSRSLSRSGSAYGSCRSYQSYASHASAPAALQRLAPEDQGICGKIERKWPPLLKAESEATFLNRDGSLYRQVDVRLVRGDNGFLFPSLLPFAERTHSGKESA